MKKLANTIPLSHLNQTTATCLLEKFSRDELRQLANYYGIPRGRNKSDTIRNLLTHKNSRGIVLKLSFEENLLLRK